MPPPLLSGACPVSSGRLAALPGRCAVAGLLPAALPLVGPRPEAARWPGLALTAGRTPAPKQWAGWRRTPVSYRRGIPLLNPGERIVRGGLSGSGGRTALPGSDADSVRLWY